MRAFSTIRSVLFVLLVAWSTSGAAGDNSTITDATTLIAGKISRFEALSKSFREFADSIDNERSIGTAFNEIGAQESSCYSLGLLLGHRSDVASLVPSEEADLQTKTPENANVLRVSAQELDNFVLAAKSALTMSHDERTQTWNADCVGQLKIPLSSHVSVRSTSFTLQSDGTVLRILGDIGTGFADEMIEAIQKYPKVKTIALGGSGNAVDEAMRAGQYIRDHRLDTTLWNGCFAACPFVFMGGVSRMIWSPYPEIGFHQFIDSSGSALRSGTPAFSKIVNYLDAMGVDRRLIIHALQDAAPTSMTIIEGHEDLLCQARLATWVQRGCSAQ